MSHILSDVPDTSRAQQRPAAVTARRAYAELLLIFSVAFSAPSVYAIAIFLSSLGTISTDTSARIAADLQPFYIGLSFVGWCTALRMAHQDLARSATRDAGAPPLWSDNISATGRARMRWAMLGSLPVYLWALADENSLMQGDVIWRWLQVPPVVALTLLVLARHGISPASLGLRRRRLAREAVLARRTYTWSMSGIIASTTASEGLLLLAIHLDPHMVLGFLGNGVTRPQLTPNGVVAMALMSLSAGICEELVLTALLVTLLLSAGRRRWEWLALAAVLRVVFHLFNGPWDVTAVVFAMTNAAVYARTRRIVPIIVAHAVFDTLGFLTSYTRPLIWHGFYFSQLSVSVAAIPLALYLDQAARWLRGRKGR